jgi:hypothetical protein
VHNGDFESDDLSHWRILDSWSGMKSIKIEEDTSTGITTPTALSPATATVYTLQGVNMGTLREADALPRGIYIVNGKKFVKK